MTRNSKPMRNSSATVLLSAFLLASGFAFALPDVDALHGPSSSRAAPADPDFQDLPDWVTKGTPGTGPVFLVRGRVGSGESARAGYGWLAELERFHVAWGGAVAGAQDVVFLIEAPTHAQLDALLASSPWSGVSFAVEPLVRTKDRLARGTGERPVSGESSAATDEPKVGEAPSPDGASPISEPNHGDGTTHPAP